MTLDEALRRLDELGSSDDPIVHGGEELTPAGLDSIHGSLAQVAKIRIGYMARRAGKLVYVHSGTLAGMIKDREQDQ